MILFSLLRKLHASEIGAVIRLQFAQTGRPRYTPPLHILAHRLNGKEFCFAALQKVSRSFAVVIQQLPGDLQEAVCVFYLILRGLDSVEDDMSLPLAVKLPLLQNFHQHCRQAGWTLQQTGDTQDYKDLLENFDKVLATYHRLKPSYRQVIDRITLQMGHGMAEFAQKEIQTVEDYNLYCHYVAGLVGIGLSGLFVASGHEHKQIEQKSTSANAMGLFLQKTNIIRDYLEDLQADRSFWTPQVWKKYAHDLHEFEKYPDSFNALSCLNHLITDALGHVPECVAYLHHLRQPQVFRFCAIPQIMAMATLVELYNNPQVFRKSVKIRKGLAARMMVEIKGMDDFVLFLEKFVYSLLAKLDKRDPNYLITKKRLHRAIEAVDLTRISYPIPPDLEEWKGETAETYTYIEKSILF